METLGHFGFGGLISLGLLYMYDRSRFRYPKFRAWSIVGGVWSMLPHVFGPLPNSLGVDELRNQFFLWHPSTQPNADIYFLHYTIDQYDKVLWWPEHGPALEPYCSLVLAIVYIVLLVAGTKLKLTRSTAKEF